mmetsp:Transcript_34258/g.61804  ORF Transcript_34258/g.61804 Transcript_34258/m.61804 type:complete len:176 (-) Transcript_34258:375-902(-)
MLNEGGLSKVQSLKRLSQSCRFFLDKSTPYIKSRWALWLTLLISYVIRVYLINGFHIISYGLGIYNLNLILGFITPQVDPELDGPTLPVTTEEEFRPFVRRLSEFKFWQYSVSSILVGILLTCSQIFNIPVYWPILLFYWCLLFFFTMRRQIQHMIKYKYLPFSFGKKKYTAVQN